jgi:hypothetical protein
VSEAQVSTDGGILLNMESRSDRSELVRCVSCRQVYDLGFVRIPTKDRVGCPECGGAGWLAARVPIEESAAPPRE